MTSIRRHLTIRLALGTFLIAATGLLVIFLYLRFKLLEQFDNALLSRAQTLGSLVRVDDGRLEFELTERSTAEYRLMKRPDYFELWDSGGGVLARSASLATSDLPRAPDGAPRVGRKRFFFLTLPDGRSGRAVECLVEPGREDDAHDTGPAESEAAPSIPLVTLVLATNTTELNKALEHVLVVLLLVMACVSAVTIFTVARFVRRGLGPVRDIGDAVAAIGPENLTRRFETAVLPEELRPIGEKLNELLARLAGAFERERRFTSNVAHELRTPIAELRALAEVTLRWPGDGEATARSFGDVLGIARQMQAMVTALLAIARSESGQHPLTLGPVELAEVVTDAWRPHAAVANTRGLAVDINVKPMSLASDRATLATMLGNLFANAVTYTPTGGRVMCRCEGCDTVEGGRCVVEILNTNNSLGATDLPLLAEPFWRKDAARTDSSNSGLGLTLVATYAKLLDVQFTTSLPTPDVFCARLEIPCAEPPKRQPERMASSDDDVTHGPIR